MSPLPPGGTINPARASRPLPRLTGPDVIALRQRLGLTRSQFGRAFGVTSRTVMRWEQEPPWLGSFAVRRGVFVRLVQIATLPPDVFDWLRDRALGMVTSPAGWPDDARIWELLPA